MDPDKNKETGNKSRKTERNKEKHSKLIHAMNHQSSCLNSSFGR